jgi:glyceraldehyde 3-phosphate dehydrogenase
MSKIRIAINGFGRIGRITFRRLLERNNMEVVAVNDLTTAANLAHLLKYDSIHGMLPASVSSTENAIIVNNKSIRVYSEPDPAKLPWKELKIDVVIEST